MAGRPTNLTPEVQERIVNAVAAGNTYKAAAAFANVPYDTFNHWMSTGRASDDPSNLYAQFFHAVKQAEAHAEVAIVALWRAQIPTDWRAAKEFLARRFPDDWGAKETVTHRGDPEAPIHQEISVSDSPRERLARRLDEYATRTRPAPTPDGDDG